MKSMMKPRPEEMRVELGSVEVPQVYDGVIIRDEIVQRSGVAGVVVFAEDDFAHVQKGGEVFSIQDEEKVAQIECELKQLNEAIINMQANREGMSVYDEEIRSGNAQIKQTIDATGFQLVSGNPARMYELADSVRQGLEVRNQRLLNENRGSLKSLVQGRDIYAAQLADAKQVVYAVQSGVVSFIVDGQEETLTLANRGEIPKEQTTKKIDYTALSYPKVVEADAAVCKIVQSNTWYIAVYMGVGETEGWTVDSIRTLYIDEEGQLSPLEVRVDSITTVSASERYVVFRCARQMTDYLDCRNVRFRLEQNVIEGLKIPNTAIAEKVVLKIPKECVMKNGAQNNIVMRRTESGDESIKVEIWGSDETTRSVSTESGLKLGDVLMTESVDGKPSEERTISVTDSIKGVYVTNSDTTVFRVINMEGRTMSNALYTVLDPMTNTQVQVNDRIVSDVDGVSEDVLLH